ncbi:hypothetical protein CEXT_477971 [Caerostris extrusa]|uniref:Uncharacterized protein n=1 Tax=Caerostris extrusa TaxID=172846 RepID=A0AAV4WF09_CAEEX|nr:hypothetical protein CEXT_477971 [Caerostris extrusa]
MEGCPKFPKPSQQNQRKREGGRFKKITQGVSFASMVQGTPPAPSLVSTTENQQNHPTDTPEITETNDENEIPTNIEEENEIPIRSTTYKQIAGSGTGTTSGSTTYSCVYNSKYF